MSDRQINGTMLQGFSWNLPADGQHWRRLGQMADRLVDEGITSVWMPPAYKGYMGIKDVGYGVYDLWDLGEFDQKDTIPTKYGTRREYGSAIVALQQAGIDVLADVVLNHKMGADAAEEVQAREVAADNRLYDMGPLAPITAWTRYTFPGRAGELDDFEWDWHCFKGVDYNADEEKSGVWLFEGKGWDSDVSQEMGNFDFLMGDDIDLHNEDVYEQLVKWGTWFVESTGVDGLRLDAIKHMSRAFYLRWLKDIRKAVDRDLFVVGEYWSWSVDELRGYMGEEQAMSLFDVPLHFAFYRASVDREHIDFAHMLQDGYVTYDPVHTVTFVDNHDTQPNQALESTVESWFKPIAYSIILLREAGYPCVFFADLFGLPNDAIPAVAELPLLMEIRRRYAYGAQHDYMDEADLAGWTREGDPEDEDSGLAVVLCNREVPQVVQVPVEPEPEPEPEAEPVDADAELASEDADASQAEEPSADETGDDVAPNQEDAEDADGEGEPTDDAPETPEPQFEELILWPDKKMFVGEAHAGETWRCVLGDDVTVTIGDDGIGCFPAASASMVAVYLPEEAAAKLDHIPIVVPR